MPTLPATVDIDCPRCNEPIVCTLETAPLPGDGKRHSAQYEARVPDLAERMAAHYAAAH